MPTTSPLQGIPLPIATDADNVPYDLTNAVTFFEKRLVMRFDSVAARNAAIPSPEPGMVAYIGDTGEKWECRQIGAWVGWAPEIGTQVAYLTQVTATSIGTAGNTAITWDTEILDVLNGHAGPASPYYIPTVPGRYRFEASVAYVINATGYRAVHWYKSGVDPGHSSAAVMAASNGATVVVAFPFVTFMNGTTDTVTVAGMHGLGSGPLNTNVGAPWRSTFSATWLGPV